MAESPVTFDRTRALAAAVLTAAALPLSAVHLAVDGREPGLAWLGMAAAVVGAALLACAGLGRAWAAWAGLAAAVPVSYLVLSTAPLAVTRDVLAVVRWLVSVAGLGAYVRMAWPLAARRMYGYGLGCAGLGVAALFFVLWEPPPPKPVPIARPLIGLEQDLRAKLPGWTGRHEPLPEAIEKVLGADEYLNLELVSPDRKHRVLVFITYNANAMSNIPHVPWVCMTQSGFNLVSIRQDDVVLPAMRSKEFKANVILFKPGPTVPQQGQDAMMFQYFNVGGTYETSRQLARIMATSGAIGRRGSFFSQTQVAIWFASSETAEPAAKTSPIYEMGMGILNAVVPLLESRYYPNLGGTEGG